MAKRFQWVAPFVFHNTKNFRHGSHRVQSLTHKWINTLKILKFTAEIQSHHLRLMRYCKVNPDYEAYNGKRGWILLCTTQTPSWRIKKLLLENERQTESKAACSKCYQQFKLALTWDTASLTLAASPEGRDRTVLIKRNPSYCVLCFYPGFLHSVEK